MRQILIEKWQLEQMYLTEDRSVPEIARLLGVAKSTVWHWLKDLGIGIKSREIMSEAYDGHGYVMVYVPGHHRASAVGRVKRAVLVWERANGREMPDGWVPHHRNCVKDDDRPENLDAMPRPAHARLHAELRRATTGTRSWGRWNRKLCREKAREIRRRATAGERTGALADEYGVSPATVSNIKYGRQWI